MEYKIKPITINGFEINVHKRVITIIIWFGIGFLVSGYINSLHLNEYLGLMMIYGIGSLLLYCIMFVFTYYYSKWGEDNNS